MVAAGEVEAAAASLFATETRKAIRFAKPVRRLLLTPPHCAPQVLADYNFDYIQL